MKVHDLVITIRSSPQRRQRFEEICKELHMEHLVLLPDVPTRWNSSFDMFERVLKMRPVILKCETSFT